MKIINICSNYGSYKDGIGSYSKNMIEQIKKNKTDIEFYIFSSDTTKLNKIERFFSLKMTKNILYALRKIKQEKVDIVNIEYPFIEWNPLILLAYKILVEKCIKNKVKVVISLHEYTRVNFFRKKVIEFMVKRADTVLVTQEDVKEKLSSICKEIYIRNIPSNIPLNLDLELKEKNMKQYVFFGLINKSKAFFEMIEGWKKFQCKNKECELIIITSSDVSIKEYEKYNIIVKKNLSENKIGQIMAEAGYCILPIKPNVGYNNATLKTATLFKCIPIGKFNKTIEKEYEFFVNMTDYTKNDFFNALTYTVGMKEIKIKQQDAKNFGSEFSINNIADDIIKIYIKMTKEKDKC